VSCMDLDEDIMGTRLLLPTKMCAVCECTNNVEDI
jgi:hypothetical protein